MYLQYIKSRLIRGIFKINFLKNQHSLKNKKDCFVDFAQILLTLNCDSQSTFQISNCLSFLREEGCL